MRTEARHFRTFANIAFPSFIVQICIIILSILTIAPGIRFYDNSSRYLGLLLFFCSIFLVVISASLSYQNMRVAEEEKKQQESCLGLDQAYKQQLDMLRAKQHDLRNQLTAIREMAGNRQFAAISDIAELAGFAEGQIDEVSMLLKLNNTIISMLLYNKYKIAHEKGIELKVKNFVADPSYSGRGQYDLTAILSNLLDNAIEAARMGDEIAVEIGERSGFLCFTVTNSGNLPECEINRLFSAGFSTKGSNRGYGLSNVRQMVMKYGGNIELTANGGRIEFRVYLPVPA